MTLKSCNYATIFTKQYSNLKFILLSIACIVGMAGCGPYEEATQVKLLQTELEEARKTSETLHTQAIGRKGSESANANLVHVVWFKLKEELSDESVTELIAEIEKLNQIAVVHELEIGRFCDLQDARAMSDFGLVMSMRFTSKDDYQTYQNHPVHVALKGAVKVFLAAPPVTYDYIAEN